MTDRTLIVNMHAHLCRDPQQEKQVFPIPGLPDDWYRASPERQIPWMDLQGVTHTVMMNVMGTHGMMEQRVRRARAAGSTDAEIAKMRADLAESMRQRVREMNDWSLAAQAKQPRLRAYVAIDPHLFGNGAIEELERCIKLGATGLKLHPSINMHFPNDEAMMPVYERCQELGLGVLADSNGHPSDDGVAYGAPRGWIPVLKAFPHLKFIMAHLGDDMWDDRLEMSRQFGDNLRFDFSHGLVDAHHPAGGHHCMPTTQAVRVFRKVGVDRIMYGSDGRPGSDGEDLYGARQIMALPFTESEKDQMLRTNAMEFFGLSPIAMP